MLLVLYMYLCVVGVDVGTALVQVLLMMLLLAGRRTRTPPCIVSLLLIVIWVDGQLGPLGWHAAPAHFL